MFRLLSLCVLTLALVVPATETFSQCPNCGGATASRAVVGYAPISNLVRVRTWRFRPLRNFINRVTGFNSNGGASYSYGSNGGASYSYGSNGGSGKTYSTTVTTTTFTSYVVPQVTEPVPLFTSTTEKQPAVEQKKYVSTYASIWTWPGMTERSLRQHLIVGHGYAPSRVNNLPFDECKRLHDQSHDGLAML